MNTNYADWLKSIPSEFTGDPIWKLEVYRLALYSGDIGWQDVLALSKNSLTRSMADQLFRALGSVSANLTEGFSRSKGLDRARFFEYSLGSARECRDWYYKSRHVLGAEIVNDRLRLHTKIVSMLAAMISHQRTHALREQPATYDASRPSSEFDFDDNEVPPP